MSVYCSVYTIYGIKIGRVKGGAIPVLTKIHVHFSQAVSCRQELLTAVVLDTVRFLVHGPRRLCKYTITERFLFDTRRSCM